MKVINQVELPLTPYTSTILGCPAPLGATCIVVGDTWRSAPFKVGDTGNITTIQLYYENEPENISLKIVDTGLEFYQGHLQSRYVTVLMADERTDKSVTTMRLLVDDLTQLSITTEVKDENGAWKGQIVQVPKNQFAFLRSPTGIIFYIFGQLASATRSAALYSVYIGDTEYKVVNPITSTINNVGRWEYTPASRLIEVITPNN